MRRRNLSNAWTGDIAIEVPETGISIGQLERTLKARFGHDQHIEGDLVQTEKGGLALTVRGTGILSRTFTDEVPNLNKLLTEAGEYVFGQSQPGLWAAYLSNNDRYDDAISFAQAAYPAADSSERPYLLNYWANSVGGKEGGSDVELRQSLTLYWEALRLKPDFWLAYNNIMNALEPWRRGRGCAGGPANDKSRRRATWESAGKLLPKLRCTSVRLAGAARWRNRRH